MLTDVRLAFRQLAKSPAFTTVAILTLAIGIGASVAMFGVLRALILQPFSYPQAEQLVQVWSNEGQPLSTPDYFDVAEQMTSFAEFGVYSPQASNLGGENPQALRSVGSTSGVLRAFGVVPALGRLIEAADEAKGAAPVVVLSHALWRDVFGGDPALVGRMVRIDGRPTTVVGIMPADFEFAAPWMQGESAQAWFPLGIQRGDGDRGSHWICGLARLKPGVPIATADAELKAIGARLSATYPNSNTHKPFFLRSLHQEMTRRVGSQVWLLFGAVVLVLVVACANVASMLLARSARRHAEIGVRIALGATRAQIVRLSLTESLLLAAAGMLAGLGLAAAGLQGLRAFAPVSDARKAAMVLDGGVVAFAAGLALLTALLAGLPPALAALRVSVSDLLRTEGRGATGSRTRHHLLRALIVAQVAVAFMLANGAALFSASYAKLLDDNRALATDRVLSMELNLRGERYADKETRARFMERLAEEIAALPGVTAAGITTKLPLEGGSNTSILVNNEVFDPAADRPLAEVSSITPGYFAAAGVALLRGRTLEPGDSQGEIAGAVVNRALADKCWPGQDPLGKLIRGNDANPWFTARVVGVVENVRQWGAAHEPNPEIYWTTDRAWGRTMFLIVHSPQPAARLVPALRHQIARLDPDLPLARIRTFQTVVDEAMKGQHVVTTLIDGFMAAALGLVALGLYGTLSYHVLQRTREIGVRLAIGASRRDVLRLVFRQGAAWAVAGILIGAGGSFALASALRALVYGVDTFNAVTPLLAAGTVLVAALVACGLPAWRAARVDPIVALRAD
jgi:putative ABC transport system permease protein